MGKAIIHLMRLFASDLIGHLIVLTDICFHTVVWDFNLNCCYSCCWLNGIRYVWWLCCYSHYCCCWICNRCPFTCSRIIRNCGRDHLKMRYFFFWYFDFAESIHTHAWQYSSEDVLLYEDSLLKIFFGFLRRP